MSDSGQVNDRGGGGLGALDLHPETILRVEKSVRGPASRSVTTPDPTHQLGPRPGQWSSGGG